MDGVIVESVPIHTLAAQNVLHRYGLALTDEEYRQHFAGRTDEAGLGKRAATPRDRSTVKPTVVPTG